MRPDADVLIPVRDGGRLLRRAVDSVLSQEGPAIRVFVVDDGSTDGAVERLPRDPRLVVLRNRFPPGAAGALETALRAGDAPYVARQDADDESLPGRFAAQLGFLEGHPGIGLVGSAFEIAVGDRVIATLTGSPAGLLEHNPFCAGSVTVRRAVLERAGGHRPDLTCAEDYDCWLRCAWLSGVAMLPTPLYRYRLSAGMSMIARRRTVEASAALARASARARMEGRPDPVEDAAEVARVAATRTADPAADAELLAWWAREFAALGARREAVRCARRLPWRRRAGLLGRIARGGETQAVWT